MKNTALPTFSWHRIPRILVIIVALLILISLTQFNLPHSHAAVTNYYVSSSGGSDSNVGTLSSPFATIQKCANMANAGDTCFIRGGTYRETVTPPHSGTSGNPITFTAYNNEAVTVSGLDVVSGWSQSSGSIYVSSGMSWDLGLGNNQIFVDQQMVNEARWPNIVAGADLSHPTLAHVQSASYSGSGTGVAGTINDSNLPTGLTGAKINAAVAAYWVMQTGNITSSSAGSVTFTYDRPEDYIHPDTNQSYFVWGKLSLLDTANESFYDSATHKLYLWTPQSDNPGNHQIEAKHRQHAFDLSERSYVVIQHLQTFGADILTNSNSQNNTLDGLTSSYLTHALNINSNPWDFRMYDSGIVLTGLNNTLKNSVIAYSSANGVSLSGTNQHVINNVIHDVDYAATDDSAVTTGSTNGTATSTGHEITYNTLYNSGRSVLVARTATQTRITHNELYNAGLQVTDLGMLYTFATDGGGTVIAYNLVHDNLGVGNNVGIYLDNNSQNYIVHHNVVWNAGTALCLNTPSYNNSVYNNTLLGYNNSVSSWPEGVNMGGTVLKNNIFTANLYGLSSEVVQQNNINQGTDPLFTNPGTHDYTLQSNSPAIDAGQVISPYTDGYNGSAPDAGAYEYGATQWTAGATQAARAATSTIQAESYDAQSGISDDGTTIGSLDNGDWALYRNIDFGSGVSQFQANIAVPAQYAGQQIELHTDSLTGPLLGTLTVQSTGDWTTFTAQSVGINSTTGVHDLYLAFKGTYGVGNLDWFRFTSSALSTIQAENYDAQSGVSNDGTSIGSLDNGDWVLYHNVNFGSGVSQFQANIAVPAQYAGQQIEIHIDSLTGTLLGTLTVQSTGDWATFTVQSVGINSTTGTHDLYLAFKGTYGVGNLDWFRFA